MTAEALESRGTAVFLHRKYKMKKSAKSSIIFNGQAGHYVAVA